MTLPRILDIIKITKMPTLLMYRKIFLTLIVATAIYIPALAQAQVCEDASKLTALQVQSRLYRNKGLQAQNMGNLQEALSWYQKAVEMDPSFAVAYNDIGVIYEANGLIQLAEQNYLKANKMDPNYLSVYSNLAALYESKRDFDKAALYWEKRSKLGVEGDPWKAKAEQRLRDISEILPSLKLRFMEQDAMKLNKDLLAKKAEAAKQAQEHVKVAKKFFDSNDYDKAMVELEAALNLDSKSSEALELMDRTRARIKQREKQAAVQKMQEHFQRGLKYYEQEDVGSAEREFGKITELTASPQ